MFRYLQGALVGPIPASGTVPWPTVVVLQGKMALPMPALVRGPTKGAVPETVKKSNRNNFRNSSRTSHKPNTKLY